LSELGDNAVVILSTHIVDDVKELCTKMAVINKGEVLLEGNPLQAIDSIKGKVWKKIIEKESLLAYKNQYNVVSEKLIAGKPIIHILSESDPAEGFESVEPDLEDVYFAQIFGEREVQGVSH